MVKTDSTIPRSKAFVAILHPLAARFNLKPHLSDVTLTSVLTGDTCAPISLSDFEKYLTFVEYSVENLQFLVWFQDYQKRYLKSFNEPSSSSNRIILEEPSYATQVNATESINKTRKEDGMENRDIEFPATPNEAMQSPSLSPLLPPVYVQLTSPSIAIHGSKSLHPDPHGFRHECLRAVATFLTPGSPKELPLDAIIRDTAIHNLSRSCHPDIFLHIYEEVYSSLERCSLPRFLLAASANINLPKQLYWYTMGTLNMLLGILIVLLLIMFVPTPPEANRAWRIVPILIFVVGGGQFYSAWRGSCTQIWRRGATQLRAWEMQEADTEAQTFVEGVLNQHKAFSQSAIALQEKSQPGQLNVAAIAPFSIETQGGIGRPSVSSDTIPSYATVPPEAGAPTDHNLRRPPIFGPETVVLDPRIKAVHRQLVIDVHRFGVYLLLVSSAIVFSVPGRLHSRP